VAPTYVEAVPLGDVCTTYVAAAASHLAALPFAHERQCPLYEQACSAAAAAGWLDVLRWLHERGGPWDGTTAVKGAARRARGDRGLRT
jgi:hypothetical protein